MEYRLRRVESHFHPDTAKGNSGPAGIATIKDGKFDTRELGGKKVAPGHNTVFISSYGNGLPGGNAPDMMPANEVKVVPPAEYQLSWEIPENEGRINIDFDVDGE